MTPPNGVRQLGDNIGVVRDVFAKVRHAEGDVPSLVLGGEPDWQEFHTRYVAQEPFWKRLAEAIMHLYY